VTTTGASLAGGTLRETDAHPSITLKYFHKSHIDLIPAFSLAGKPKYLDEWRNRERYWPQRQTVDDIYHSNFFVVEMLSSHQNTH
jgi:hypothetical protein